MIVKFLGLLDLIIGILFLSSVFFGLLPKDILAVLGVLLILKGLIFISRINWVSVLDIIFGILIILTIYMDFGKVVTLIISIFLIQKGIFSFI